MDVLQLPLRGLIALAVLTLLSACADTEADPEPNTTLLAQGRQYVEDDTFARDALERSLLDPNNGYAQLRLQRYTPEHWGALPLWNPPTSPARPGEAPDPGEPLEWDSVPWTLPDLIELGRRAFLRYPAQIATSAHIALDADTTPEDTLGLWTTPNEGLGGLVWTTLPRGEPEPALTCASCHAAIHGKELILGLNNHRLDLGTMMARSASNTTSPAAWWGPGRLDVTPDNADNPVAIPDLRATRHQTHLHRTGSVINDPIALAIRIETLLITSHGEGVRPPRKVTLALALFLWSLEPTPMPPTDPEAHDRGAALFTLNCATCHREPGLSGPPVPLDEVGTDPSVGLSTTRGTGGYRAPSLHGVGSRTMLTATGAIPDLRALLDPARQTPGHRYGHDLNSVQRADLLIYLDAL